MHLCKYVIMKQNRMQYSAVCVEYKNCNCKIRCKPIIVNILPQETPGRQMAVNADGGEAPIISAAKNCPSVPHKQDNHL